jgi:predicted acetyltransferase
MTVRKLKLSDETAFFAAIAKWPKDIGFHLAIWYREGISFSDYLNLLDERERGENLEPSMVPMTLLFGFINDEIVGRVSLRHRLNENLLRSGGNVGYGVLPAFRGQGIATSLLKEILLVARARGLDRVLLTCDDSNSASIKTIEKCDGILENVIDLPTEDGIIKERRYWIELES